MFSATLFALALFAAASPAHAQNSSAYFTGLSATLTGLGATRLVAVASQVLGTPAGQQLFSSLPSGNSTLFAPNDRAFGGRPNDTDANTLADVFAYHIVSGAFQAGNLSSAPGHTLLRTRLNDTRVVMLEGNRSQVLDVTNDNGTIKILGQDSPVQVVSSGTYQNLVIHVIDAVLAIPPVLADIVTSDGLTAFSAAATTSGMLPSLENEHGVTIFAPNDQAFDRVLRAVGGPSNVNASTLRIVLGNHVINGTSVYGTQFNTTTSVSASGEPFKFATNSSGTYVSSGSSTARIVRPDVLMQNGVVHIIDNVLFNTQNNSAAASSALASATSVAAQAIGQTGAVPTASGSSNKSNGAVTLNLPFRELIVALALVLSGVVSVL